MQDDLKRPNPDELLARVKQEEEAQARGRLKIFLGYVAGVGKTYAMLEAAHQRLKEGLEVVVGYIETHGRQDTEAMLAGLTVIPRRVVDYRGTSMTEMDLDEVLAKHPQLVLVDELAHTNVPGSRHAKRYLDVEEILASGIDVYTTVNIQHLESLKDVVQQITGVVIHETIPDRLVDEATEIELVDLPVDELLKRLKDGKVYVPEAAARALEQFFRKGNLTALRELSMRRAAERVDNQMVDYMQTKAIPGPWPAGEHILVCLSSHPMGERLIRAGRRLADDLKAEWTVLYVETPGHLGMPPHSRDRLQMNLHLAEELGAKVVSLTEDQVADAVIRYAHENNITKIIAGKVLRPRWYETVRGSVIDQILRNSGKIDVYVISEETQAPQHALMADLNLHSSASRYGLSLLLVIGVTALGFPLRMFLDATNLVMIYLLGVVIAAIFLGRGPSILASVASVLTFDFFFVNPLFSFSVSDSQYLLTFLVLLGVGIFISNSAAMLRGQVEALRQRQAQTQALNRFGGELTSVITLNEVIETVIRNVGEMFGRETAVLLPADDGKSTAELPVNLTERATGRLVVAATSKGFSLSGADLAVADWAYKNRRSAGRGTDTLSASEIRFVPLVSLRGTVGILGFRALDPSVLLSAIQRELLEGVVNLSALAIERASLSEKAAQTEMLRQTETLQTALLNSISHELRTPLATITGVLTSLRESIQEDAAHQLDPATCLDLIDSATHQSGRLNRLVENLLDMTRLEAGALRLNREPGDLPDLIRTILAQSADRFCDHSIHTELSSDLPLVEMDAVLIGQVLDNLLDNACKYSPSASPIVISTRVEGKQILVSVQDAGKGIPTGHLELIFDKFYRIQGPQDIATGTGLGLSICRGIVEAHGGKIWAKNNPDVGACFTFFLPVSV